MNNDNAWRCSMQAIVWGVALAMAGLLALAGPAWG